MTEIGDGAVSGLEPLDAETRAANRLDSLSGLEGGLFNILRELQGLTIIVTTGALQATPINCPGIKANDQVLAVIGTDPDNGNQALSLIGVDPADVNIAADDTITTTTTSTSGYKLIVAFYRKGGSLL